jgi:hypothetical protein
MIRIGTFSNLFAYELIKFMAPNGQTLLAMFTTRY